MKTSISDLFFLNWRSNCIVPVLYSSWLPELNITEAELATKPSARGVWVQADGRCTVYPSVPRSTFQLLNTAIHTNHFWHYLIFVINLWTKLLSLILSSEILQQFKYPVLMIEWWVTGAGHETKLPVSKPIVRGPFCQFSGLSSQLFKYCYSFIRRMFVSRESDRVGWIERSKRGIVGLLNIDTQPCPDRRCVSTNS